jgi:glucosamine--fructose-6-phosphate aminotransferase (isomerizing)
MFRDDVCCFISQSGETADTLRAMEYCKQKGAYTVGFTNTVGSAIARTTDCGAHINAGYEIGVASTKAYTSQCIAIILLAVRLAQDSVSKQSRRAQILDGLKRLPAVISQALKLDADMKKLAQSLKDSASILIMGRGYQGATCREAALKIKELTYIHAEGILTGELKHGSLALIDENLPVIVIATKDAQYDKAKAGLQQVVARKGKAIVLLSEPDPEVDQLATTVVMVPSIGVDSLQGIVNIIPFQLLAYHLAVARGYDVDNPRNLAKSVTVE